MTSTQPTPPRSSPPTLDADYASVFSASKQAVISAIDADRSAIVQQGPAVIGTLGDLAGLRWPTEVVADDAMIETFVVGPEAGCMSTGSDSELIAAWKPLAKALAERVFATAAEHGIPIAEPAYLTTTVTPAGQTIAEAHFDDDLFDPSDGVGLVAIVGSIDGPRVASGVLEVPSAPPGAQIPVSEKLLATFDRDEGDFEVVPIPADAIVVFPQFGQLHAGPMIDESFVGSMRYLMVLRAGTVPVDTEG